MRYRGFMVLQIDEHLPNERIQSFCMKMYVVYIYFLFIIVEFAETYHTKHSCILIKCTCINSYCLMYFVMISKMLVKFSNGAIICYVMNKIEKIKNVCR